MTHYSALMNNLIAARRAPPSRVLGPRADLRAAVVENDYARADEFCAPPENPAGFDIFDNSREAKSIVQRLSNPMMLLRDITEVNGAMVIGHGVITF
jgi:hypothetical protein